MKKTINVLLVLAVSLISVSAQAAWTGRLSVSGKIVSVNEKTVTLQTSKSAIAVPKAALPKGMPLAIGNFITAKTTLAELKAVN